MKPEFLNIWKHLQERPDFLLNFSLARTEMQVDATQKCTLVVTRDDDVFAIGHDDKKIHRVATLCQKKIKTFELGSLVTVFSAPHYAALSEDGRLFMFGGE